MDLQRFSKILKRFAWVLIMIPILAASLTYYLLIDLPKEYRSEALISTGLTDHSQQAITNANQNTYLIIKQQFENIIEYLKLKKNINSLSYKLIIHDLENPDDAFNPLINEIIVVDSSGRVSLINEYKRLLEEGKILTPLDNGTAKLFDFVQLLGYGESTILDNLKISRKDNNSDFIQVGYLSENPYLSVYVVNTVANDFIESFKERSNSNRDSSKELLDSLLRDKEASMNVKNTQIKDFQVKNSVIDLRSQAQQVFAQIGEKDALRATTINQIQSLQGAIQGIEEKLKSRNTALLTTNQNDNNKIIALKNELQKANEKYVTNNFKPEDARLIDSLQLSLSKLNASSPANVGSDPKLLRQALMTQKMTMEVELDKAKSGLEFLLKDLAQMRAEFSRMVPDNAGMKNFEREAEVATKEYLNALDMYNQNSVQKSSMIRPQMVQAGILNPAEPSKIKIYAGLAGFASFGTCIFALVISFLLDRRIRTSDQLLITTSKRIIGQINRIVPNNTSLQTVWEEGKSNHDYSLYKDLIRSLRFEIDEAFKQDFSKVIGVTGLYSNSGSSFISSSLAYSFAVAKKRVLLIGGEYVLDKTAKVKEISEDQFFDSYIVKREIHADQFITKLTTNTKNESLLEIYSEDVLRKGFEELKREFDVIIVDVQSLQKVHRAKEWLMFVDKSIAIFPAGEVVGPYEKELISFINGHDGFLGWVLNKAKVDDLGLLNMIRSN